MCLTHRSLGGGVATASRPAASHPSSVPPSTRSNRPAEKDTRPSKLADQSTPTRERPAASRPTSVPASSKPAVDPKKISVTVIAANSTLPQFRAEEKAKTFDADLLRAITDGKLSHDKVAGAAKDIKKNVTAKVLRDIAVVLASRQDFALRLGDISEVAVANGAVREKLRCNVAAMLNSLKIEVKIRPDFLKL